MYSWHTCIWYWAVQLINGRTWPGGYIAMDPRSEGLGLNVLIMFRSVSHAVAVYSSLPFIQGWWAPGAQIQGWINSCRLHWYPSCKGKLWRTFVIYGWLNAEHMLLPLWCYSIISRSVFFHMSRWTVWSPLLAQRRWWSSGTSLLIRRARTSVTSTCGSA